MKKATALAALAFATTALAAPATAATSIELNTDGTWQADGEAVEVLEGGQSNYGPAVGDSKWIKKSGNPVSGTYSFVGLINLQNVGAVQNISAIWRADNLVTRVLLNGLEVFSQPIPNTKPDEFSPNRGPFDFSLDLNSAANLSGAAWRNGENSVTFDVFQRECCPQTNDLALTASVMGSAVPEPGTWLLMIFGLGAVGFAMRRRRDTVVHYQFA